MDFVTYTDARNNLARTLDKVVEERGTTVVTRTGREGVVMIAKGEWDAIEETLHLLATPRNAERLREAVAELEAGGGKERSLSDEPQSIQEAPDNGFKPSSGLGGLAGMLARLAGDRRDFPNANVSTDGNAQAEEKPIGPSDRQAS